MMLKKTNQKLVSEGFTLIELLVVISIIVVLLSIFATGMQKVKMIATNLRQKSQFHAMEIGLELFQKDFDNYPTSMSNSVTGGMLCGANHFTESLIGRDKRGYEPSQNFRWYPPGDDPCNFDLYDYDSEKSKLRRKPLYVEIKDIGVYELAQLYTDPCGVYDSSQGESPVFTDGYRQKIVSLADGQRAKAGTPILYYRANSSSNIFREAEDNPATSIDETDYTKWIYNYDDNEAIISLGKVKDNNVPHDMDRDKFYETITSPKATITVGSKERYKPFNENSYLLISAGYDGIFGTKDDINNFGY